MDKDKRRSLRINKQIDARYQRIINDKTAWIMISVTNLSESGICLLIDRFPFMGENFLLRIRTPLNPKEWFQINAKVVDVDIFMNKVYWARLEFINLNPEYKDKIKEYIDCYLKRGNYR